MALVLQLAISLPARVRALSSAGLLLLRDRSICGWSAKIGVCNRSPRRSYGSRSAYAAFIGGSKYRTISQGLQRRIMIVHFRRWRYRLAVSADLRSQGLPICQCLPNVDWQGLQGERRDVCAVCYQLCPSCGCKLSFSPNCLADASSFGEGAGLLSFLKRRAVPKLKDRFDLACDWLAGSMPADAAGTGQPTMACGSGDWRGVAERLLKSVGPAK